MIANRPSEKSNYSIQAILHNVYTIDEGVILEKFVLQAYEKFNSYENSNSKHCHQSLPPQHTSFTVNYHYNNLLVFGLTICNLTPKEMNKSANGMSMTYSEKIKMTTFNVNFYHQKKHSL